MVQVIRRLFRIHEGEGRKVFHFALLASLLQAGLAIGISAADSLFLVNLTAEKLPVIYLITPLIMLVYIPVYAYLMGRVGIERLVDITLGVLAGGGVLLYWGLTHPPAAMEALIPGFMFYATKLYTALWYIGIYTLIWNFIDCYFDILDAKRLFSLLSGGMAFGSIMGGGMISLMVKVMSVEQLFLVWALLSVAAFPVVALVRRTWTNLGQGGEAESEEPHISFVEQTGVIWRVFKTSRYSNFMVLAFLSTLMVTTLCEFQYMTVFEKGRTDGQVAALFGWLYASVNVFNLVVNLFLFNRLVAHLGVRNTALIQPMVYLAAFSFLLLDYGFWAAVAGFFAYQGILTSIEYNNQNFLFNALPSRGKAEVRTFIEGLCEPLATASAGMFLIFFSKKLSPQSLSVVGLAGTVVVFLTVLGLRANYLKAIVDNLKQTWLDFARPHVPKLSHIHYPELGVVEQLATSTHRDIALAAVRILSLNDVMSGLVALLAFIDRGSPADQRAAAPLLAEALRSQDGEIFRRMLEWIEKAKTRLDPLLLEECGRHNLLSAEDIRALSASTALSRRSAAAVALWNSWKVDGNLECIGITKALIEGTPAERVAAIRIIGKSGRPRYAHFLATYLADPLPAIRHEALEAMAALVTPDSARLAHAVLEAVEHGDHAMRLDGLEVLGRIRTPECIKPLALMSDRFTPFERRRAEAVIVGIGLESVPVLTALLKDPRCCLASKSIVSRSLGHLSFPQFESLAPALIESQIERAYATLCAHGVMAREAVSHPELDFLARFYRDYQASVVDSVLEVLTISGRLPDYEMMAASLHSKNVKERGNAIETIEQGCSREIFAILLPLLDARPMTEKIAFYLRHFRTTQPSTGQVLEAGIRSHLQMESAAAIQAAWRMLKRPGGVPVIGQEILCRMIKERLMDPSLDLVEETAFALMAESEGGASGLGVVDKAHLLSRAPFFGQLSMTEVEWMARPATVVTVRAGETLYRRGEPCPSAYVVIEGSMTLDGAAAPGAAGEPALIGGEALKGGRIREATASSPGGARLLAVPSDVVMEAAQVYPQVAIGLLAFKLGVTERAA